MQPNQFRLLITAHLAFLAAFIGSAFMPNRYTQEIEATFAAEPVVWLLQGSWLANSLVLVIFAALLSSIVGLYRFKRWARPLALWTLAAEFVIYLFLGPTVQSTLENTFMYAGNLSWGAVLALAYFSPPISSRFEE